MRSSLVALVLAVVALGSGCSQVDEIECVDDSECPGTQCIGGQCVVGDDTGVGDVEVDDTGESDSGPEDTEETDSGDDAGPDVSDDAEEDAEDDAGTDVEEDSGTDASEDAEDAEDAGELCGNGTLDEDEACDGSSEEDPNADVCRDDCTFCGDGVVQESAGETCDPPGGAEGGLGCRDTCTYCGDGIEEPALGESCDDGDDNSNTEPGACRLDCSEPYCGDGVTDSPDEECDPADTVAYPAGLECSIFSCTVESQGRCQPCTSDDTCVGGLECAIYSGGGTSTRCYAACDTIADCPPEHECTPQIGGGSNICVPTEGCDSYPYEACADLTDNDFDGDVDCDDADCVASPSCEATDEICDNGRDDDADGATDCDDSDCETFDGCVVTFEICFNGIDDDSNGLTDCDDPECEGIAGCGIDEICNNEIDDDGDMLWDCADPDCASFDLCEEPETSCNDGFDNDGDFRYDCDDPDCETQPICLEFEVCDNGFDDDFDGFIDCDDPDCSTTSECDFEFDCFNGIDDDFDDLVDCQDIDCFEDLDFCEPDGEDSCDDGIDNDSNGFADCFDERCIELGECSGLVCPIVELGPVVGRELAAVAISEDLPDELDPECVVEAGFDSGREASFTWEAPFSGAFLFTTIDSNGAHAITLHESCTTGSFACAGGSGATGDFTEVVAISRRFERGQELVGFVHAGPDVDSGRLRISIVPSGAPVEVLCNDGFNNDGDRQVDCADPDCFGAPGCECDGSALLPPELPDCGPGARCGNLGVLGLEGTCECTTDRTLCGSRCVTLSSDMQHCGECWNTCDADETCRSGECRR